MAKVKSVAHKQRGKVERADRKIARIAGAKRDTPVVKAVGRISDLADQPPLVALSILTIGAGLFSRRGKLTRVGTRMLLSHMIATQAKAFVKHRIDRTRPSVMLGNRGYHAKKGKSPAKEENSFPSGHTAGAVAVARAVARDYPESAPVGYACAATAAAAQIPRAAHFVSDVAVGGMIGIAAEALVAVILPTDTA